MSCSVKGCTNTKRFKPEGITFHRFPRGKMLKVWLEILKLPVNWQWTQNKLICSKHFKESDFIEGNIRKHLKFNSVPCLHLSTVVTPLESTDSLLPGKSDVTSGRTNISTPTESDSRKQKAETSNITTSTTIKFIQTIHSYSISPGNMRKKYQALRDIHLKSRKKLYAARKTIAVLKRNIALLKSVVEVLRKSQSLSKKEFTNLIEESGLTFR